MNHKNKNVFISLFFKTGHRGSRGLSPENTLFSFIEAIQLGANTLELDIVVSKDSKLVVSHEPYMNSEICLQPNGTEIKKEDEKLFNLYTLNYEEIKKFDCGLKIHPRFPTQKKMASYKPLLNEVIEACEKYRIENKIPTIIYDIELKSEAPEYGLSQPFPEVFAELLASFILKNELHQKVIIRSFDQAPLKYLHKNYPYFFLALIVENELSAKENIELLGFIPFMYSPEYELLNSSEITYLKEIGIVVVPWTVNSAKDIREMLDLGVNGIITDYPDLFKTMEI